MDSPCTKIGLQKCHTPIDVTMYFSLHAKWPIFLSENVVPQQIFLSPTPNFTQNRPLGAALIHAEWLTWRSYQKHFRNLRERSWWRNGCWRFQNYFKTEFISFKSISTVKEERHAQYSVCYCCYCPSFRRRAQVSALTDARKWRRKSVRLTWTEGCSVGIALPCILNSE
jgi:hypothetical protein